MLLSCHAGHLLHNIAAVSFCCRVNRYHVMQELGIPTANVDSDSLHSSLSEAVTGVYAGWVSIGVSPVVRPYVHGCL
jgi:FAD synthase